MTTPKNLSQYLGTLSHLMQFPEDRALFPEMNTGPAHAYRRVLEVDFHQLPDAVRKELRNCRDFNFDHILSFRQTYSYFFATPKAPLTDLVTKSYLIRQHEHAVTEYGFSGDLAEFVMSRHLLFYKWVLDQKFDLSEVSDIYIHTSTY